MVRSNKRDYTDGRMHYPWIGEYEGLVVLFWKPSEGAVIHAGNYCGDEHALGEISRGWVEDKFSHYHGEIVLSNY